jgi:hypothetical protein
VTLEFPRLGQFACLLVLGCALGAQSSRADPVSAVQLLRLSGCGGFLPAAQPLQLSRQLDRAAALWASGGSPLSAAEQTGYRPRQVAGLRISGSDDLVLQALRKTHCREFADQSLRDIGVYRSRANSWVLVASPAAESVRKPVSGASVLQLVNVVRTHGTRCGAKTFAPAPPLQESAPLDGVAYEHAADMARHDYFEHVDLTGRTPADRVRAIGYREKLVGENIAYGPTSAQEVVEGWLHSTGHCENLMDARFTEMGLALAPGKGTRHGLYWDQVLTQPLKQP